MFERQIEDTISGLTQQTIGSDDEINLKKIQNSTIPVAIALFFELEAAHWEADELQRMMESSHFDYTSPVLREKFEEICKLSREYTRFTRSEFLETLDRSVKLLFNYVCRPQWTLSKYIYAESTQVAATHVQEKLSHFSDYEYFRVVIGEYISSKEISSISKEKFEELIALIDNEVVRNFDSSKLARLSQPIYTLFNPGDTSEFARVPVEALSIFYDDKNVFSVVSRLDEEKHTSPSLSLHELMRLVGETDFTAGLEISQIVTRHVGRGPEPPALSETDHLEPVISFSPESDIPEFQIDAEVQDFHPVKEVDLSLVGTLDPAFEDSVPVLGGEQETPVFFDDDDTGIVSNTSGLKEMDLPDDLYIASDTATAVRDESSMELNLHLEQPSKQEISEEDDFFKQLDLSQADFELPPGVSMKDEVTIPDTALVDVEDTPQPHSDLQRTDEEMATLFKTDSGVTSPNREEEDSSTMTTEEIVATFGDLRSMIPPSEKKKYIRKLFDKNDDAYERSIDALNAKPNWREASELIDELFFSNNIDMYSRVAVTFTDEVYKRYQKRKE